MGCSQQATSRRIREKKESSIWNTENLRCKKSLITRPNSLFYDFVLFCFPVSRFFKGLKKWHLLIECNETWTHNGSSPAPLLPRGPNRSQTEHTLFPRPLSCHTPACTDLPLWREENAASEIYSRLSDECFMFIFLQIHFWHWRESWTDATISEV